MGCRIDWSATWAARIVHEASLHERNSFLTLTFRDDPISIDRSHLQVFFRSLRDRGRKLRYYACGEYGERLSRPHYHACVFGEDFSSDRYPWRVEGEHQIWRSPFLESVWTHGHSEIGSLTFESAQYVAGYVTKKIYGQDAHWRYWRVHEDTGEMVQVEPEFALMSRRPGIGRGWLDKFGMETFRDDAVLRNGRLVKPPRYYDKIRAAVDPEGFAKAKAERVEKAGAMAAADACEDQRRRRARSEITKARQSVRKRRYEA